MKTRPDTNPAAQNGVDAGRRNALKLAGLGVATLGMMPLLNVSTAKAQDMSNGANNFYTSDKVNLQKVTFKNQYQMNVAGNLFTPKTLNRNAKAPAVIVGHPMGAVKEQSANLYATKMAERGFVALSLDLPFWGESEGQPRNAVSPDIYAEDFSAAVDFLGTQAFVDRNRIGAIGICGSGSFVISAAKIDPRMKAIATVSMYDMGAANRNALKHSQTLEQRKQIIAEAAEQRYVEFTGGEAKYTSGTVHELTASSHPIEREFYDFYRTPRGEFTPKGSSPQLTTHPTLTQQRQVHELLPVQRHRDDLAASDAVHHGRPGALARVQRGCLQARGRAEGAGLRSGRGPRRSLRPREPDPVRQARILLQSASRRLGAMSARFGGGTMRGVRGMLTTTARASVLTLGLTGAAMAQEQILISSEWGKVKAELVDNEATRSLVRMLPVTIEMRDHLRQEKTGDLPSPLAPVPRQTAFSKGTLGLWSSDHFVIYYRDGRVPQPGIIILGQVTGDVSMFDRPGAVTVRVELAPR